MNDPEKQIEEDDFMASIRAGKRVDEGLTAGEEKDFLSALWLLIPILIFVGAMLYAIFILAKPAKAEEIPDNVAIQCIVGEASNQGEIGMYALASGLLNRGTTKGVYGCMANHTKNEPAWVFQMAEFALRKAKARRLHSGTYWEAVKRFGKPSWASGMKIVYQYKDHTFYKEK